MRKQFNPKKEAESKYSLSMQHDAYQEKGNAAKTDEEDKGPEKKGGTMIMTNQWMRISSGSHVADEER